MLGSSPNLYVLGAGASFPISPTTSGLKAFIIPHWLSVGSYSVSRGQHGESFDRIVGPLNEYDPLRLHLLRSNESAMPWYISYALSMDTREPPPANYFVFRMIPSGSVILNLNLDQFASFLHGYHVVLEPHGHVPANLRRVFSLQDLKEFVEYEIPLAWENTGLLIRPEPPSIHRSTEYRYLSSYWKSFQNVVIIGYSFSRFEDGIDDLQTFQFVVEMARHYRTPVALIDPNPDATASMLQDSMRTGVTVLNYRWDSLSSALMDYLKRFGLGRLAKDAAFVQTLHEAASREKWRLAVGERRRST